MWRITTRTSSFLQTKFIQPGWVRDASSTRRIWWREAKGKMLPTTALTLPGLEHARLQEGLNSLRTTFSQVVLSLFVVSHRASLFRAARIVRDTGDARRARKPSEKQEFDWITKPPSHFSYGRRMWLGERDGNAPGRFLAPGRECLIL